MPLRLCCAVTRVHACPSRGRFSKWGSRRKEHSSTASPAASAEADGHSGMLRRLFLLSLAILRFLQRFKSQSDQLDSCLRARLKTMLKPEILDLLKQLIVHGHRVARSVCCHPYHLFPYYTRVNQRCKEGKAGIPLDIDAVNHYNKMINWFTNSLNLLLKGAAVWKRNTEDLPFPYRRSWRQS